MLFRSGDKDGRDHENRRKGDDSKHLEEHEETELNEEICCLCNVVVDWRSSPLVRERGVCMGK